MTHCEGESSELLHKGPCPHCDSSDAYATYDDGHGHCFSCGKHDKTAGSTGDGGGDDAHDGGHRQRAGDLVSGAFRPLTKRGITEETCRKFGYRVGEFHGKTVQIADYFDAAGTTVVAQKLRFANKDFTVRGDLKKAGLFGQQLWGGGKMVVITEGEIDALSVSQVQNNKWPVVSIPNGAEGALKSIKKAYDWLCQFETIVLMFDMDEPGRKASRVCAELFPPGKCKIASLPLKDPNEMLLAGKGGEIINAIWQAKVYRPDGIVSGADLWEEISRDDATISVEYPWTALNDKTRGARLGELVVVTAGSGIGKSAFCREFANHLLNIGETVGYIALEESTKRTALGLMGIHLNKPLHISKDGVPDDALREAFNATVGSGRCYLYDHFGSTEIENLLARVRYLAKACDCKWIILDHLSIVVSGLGDGDERRLIDNAMTMLRTLVQETGIGLILVSHLKRPEGKGHEDGAQTSLSQLRGSAAIAQLADMVLGLERNQQDDEHPNRTTVRVLKNRFSGQTGVACHLDYDPDTGRLSEASPFDDETDNGEEMPF